MNLQGKSQKLPKNNLLWVLAGALQCFRDPLAISRLVRWRAIANHAHLARGVILDVGAGTQPYTDLFEASVNRIIAIEYPGRSPRAGVDLWADAKRIPLRDGCVHTVLCVEVLNYLPEPRRAIGEFARVLKPAGVLIMTAPLIRGASDEPNDYWRFNRAGLSLLAHEVGLEGIEITACGGICAMLGQRSGSWLYRVLVGPWRLPRWLATKACGIILAPCWLADQAGFGRDECLHWLLTARKA